MSSVLKPDDIMPVKKDLDAWLNEVDYRFLDSSNYRPTKFALTFMNFIKLVNGGEGESHKTPPVHLRMLDKMTSQRQYIANLIFRGAAKTSLFMEYMTLYIAMFGEIPGFGDISGMIYVSDSMENGVKSARKNIEFRYEKSDFMKEWVPEAIFTDPYLEFTNKGGHRLGVKMFGAKTGLRGTKIFGKRPVFCVLDDLVSDEDSKSVTSMNSIKTTVYNGVNYALDPLRRKVVFNGTPFNKQDILVEAVESGGWDVSVYPLCESFPCEEQDYRGAWPDRFPYSYAKAQYDQAVLNGKVAGFNQEMMLRLTSEEERLVLEGDIRWYDLPKLLERKYQYNFYMTTDIATSTRQTADYSVISVWAYNANGDWFWVDGVCEKQTIDKTFDDIFRLAQKYKPQSVGIEVTGQQQAYIKLIQNQMLDRNIWFNLASSEKSGEPGIRPITDKLSRFNLVVPWFKAGHMYFPESMKTSRILGICMGQIALATQSGLKGKDDFLDTISQLGYLKPWKPAESAPMVEHGLNHWGTEVVTDDAPALTSYIV